LYDLAHGGHDVLMPVIGSAWISDMVRVMRGRPVAVAISSPRADPLFPLSSHIAIAVAGNNAFVLSVRFVKPVGEKLARMLWSDTKVTFVDSKVCISMSSSVEL
jgi:hypothetical protein